MAQSTFCPQIVTAVLHVFGHSSEGTGTSTPRQVVASLCPSPILSLLFCRWKAVTHPKTRRPSPSAPLPAQRPALPSHCPTGTWRRTEPSGRARRRAARAPKAGAPRRTRRRAWRMARRAGRWRTAAAPPRRAWTPRPMRVSWPLPTPRRNAGGGNSWRPQRKVRSERSGAPTAPPGTPGPCPSCWGTGGSTRGGRGGGRRALCLVGGKGTGGLEGRPPACAHACAASLCCFAWQSRMCRGGVVHGAPVGCGAGVPLLVPAPLALVGGTWMGCTWVWGHQGQGVFLGISQQAGVRGWAP